MDTVRPSSFSPSIFPTRQLLTNLENFLFPAAFSKPLPPAWQLLQDDSFAEPLNFESIGVFDETVNAVSMAIHFMFSTKP